MSYDTWKARDFIEESQPRRPLHRDDEEPVTCFFCGTEMAPPPIRSSHPMCATCRDRQLGIAPAEEKNARGAA